MRKRLYIQAQVYTQAHKKTPVSVFSYVRLVIAVLALRVVSIFRIQFNGSGRVNTNWGVLCSVVQLLNGVTTRHISNICMYLCKLSWQLPNLQIKGAPHMKL